MTTYRLTRKGELIKRLAVFTGLAIANLIPIVLVGYVIAAWIVNGTPR